MLGWLKRLFAWRTPPTGVEYDIRPRETPPVVPAAPPTTPFPPAAPLDEPARDEPEEG